MSKEIKKISQAEILTKIQKLREIKEDVELNGIHNPHGFEMLELCEVELKEEIEKEMRENYVSRIEKAISGYKKMADQNFERDQPHKLSQGRDND